MISNIYYIVSAMQNNFSFMPQNIINFTVEFYSKKFDVIKLLIKPLPTVKH